MAPEIDAITGAAVMYIRSRKHGTFRVLIDREDWPRVTAQHWWASVRNDRVYFLAKLRGSGRHVTLHRFIMGEPEGLQVDHIRHNYCDNRKSQLRSATQLQNNANTRKVPGTTSPYKGVSRYKDKWQVGIKWNGKQKHLGHCPGTPEGEINCARLYDSAARELHGEFALTNFPA